ncbi:5-oxoprolinase subunit C family protein [Paludisphaera rhizosphaerae]|uniref:5-oxoprolinase subunit C family protein n=1 Tax=Paludisphaera rhizosphaerae TaxID=2711216 RepID=UPI0013EC38D6|nr:biotin-dependent carboxyltransferase family protein [Paludisphaera rhizosphaerae]
MNNSAGLLVIDPGFFTTVQDLGRPGLRAFGVPLGGAADRESYQLATALAGDAPGPAALEMTLRGGVFQATGDVGIALAGAEMNAEIVGKDSRRPVASPGSGWLREGDQLVLGRLEGSARAYLATPGGFRTEVRLSGRSTEKPLRAGDFLPAGPSQLESRRFPDADEETGPIRILPGPDWSRIDRRALVDGSFRVSPQSNRMGLRLEGLIEVAADLDRLSAPVIPGAIQATRGGLIVLGVASGTMGGYPHVAQVISADLDRLGRLWPGDSTAFRALELAEARRLDRERRETLRLRDLRIAAAARDALG